MRFKSTAILLDFLVQVPASVERLLTLLEVETLQKAPARVAMLALAYKAYSITTLRFEHGVFIGTHPAAAVKAFYPYACKFLIATGQAKGIKDAAVDVLDFGV
ncbi:hypothetical protein BAUCODRAFT_32883 [Baudoinia panamericana UAMH 10762]|uniref:Uncharacterized protein n=1 Tax=Baudoinia panamericana (strain UAMH 10762) TaxID=717646 RepID=M2NDZ1_BAUPA|nr:uncharacterized protein BAUCODRAFT_32883 [Baudoinia panamericana UAMH 10762]EMC97140.1 hypothetical protein BAUCODRAFT_32883 [Baudoinia panamericana UAMH 10762]